MERHDGPDTNTLFRREQHVFLPPGTERELFELSHPSIKQRKPNINKLSNGGISEAPDINNNYPIGLNADLARHKSYDDHAIESRFIHHPDYANMVFFYSLYFL